MIDDNNFEVEEIKHSVFRELSAYMYHRLSYSSSSICPPPLDSELEGFECIQSYVCTNTSISVKMHSISAIRLLSHKIAINIYGHFDTMKSINASMFI